MNELSNEELKRLSNEDLGQLFLKVRSIINRCKRNKEECVREEVYYCYISKELNARSFKS
tara:strand:- start:375 stop:554 length:180 start_codon:yes stop_codon:yes gene_type:complete